MKVKVNKRLISAAAVALLLAAPVVSWDVSSQVKANIQGEAAHDGPDTGSTGDLLTYYEQKGKFCEGTNVCAKGSRVFTKCTIKFDDHSTGCKYYLHCLNHRREKDHQVAIRTKEGKEKWSKVAKCGRTAKATVYCKWKAKTSSNQVYFWGYDGYNNYFETCGSGKKKAGPWNRLKKGKMEPWIY